MSYQEPIPVVTRTEAAVGRAWSAAQLAILFVVVGWAYIFAWNIVTACGLRRWFRKIGYTAASWAGGYIIGTGFGWFWMMRELHPFLCVWWPVAALVTLGLLRLETVGWYQAQAEAAQEYVEQEEPIEEGE
ncbi:MAG: hypothetical protein H0W83_00245 [Planctomycetes bacterium]|nr:hypothetical protein [Planctomycetota bacterium]